MLLNSTTNLQQQIVGSVLNCERETDRSCETQETRVINGAVQENSVLYFNVQYAETTELPCCSKDT